MKQLFKFLFVFSVVLGCNSNNSRPNVIFILVDDLGWNDLGYSGSAFYETPNIDKLSKESFQFTNAYAASPVCSPSRASIMTGKHPARVNITDWIPGLDPQNRALLGPKDLHNLPLEEITIAEKLKESGYNTFYVGKWHLGSQGFFPEDNGFDINVGGNKSGGPGGYFSPYVNPNLEDGPIGEYLTDRIGNEVVSFINYNQNETFFAYVPFYSVHTPIQSKKEYQEKYLNKGGDENHNRPDYAGMIESLDENIGKILNTIEELNLSEKTLIIFTSDNGGIRAISNQFPLKAGKGSYYEGGIKVPLIFSWKGKIKEESESYERVSNIDFFPTIKKIIGYKNKNLHLDGLDLNPIFKGKTFENRSLFYHFPVYLEAYNVHLDNGTDPLFRTRPGSVIIKDNWKLHHYFEDGKIELYNIEEDISESTDLSKTNLKKTKELYHDLNKWREANNAPIPLEKNPDYNQKFVDSINFLIINQKITERINN